MYVFPVWKQYGIIACGVTFILFGFIIYFHIRISRELSSMHTKEKRKSINKSKIQMARTFRKSFKIASAIVIIFILVYLPSIFMIVFRFSRKPSPFHNSYILQWIQPFTLSNVLWNPILYYYRMKSVRKKFYKALCCCETCHE